MQCLWSLKDGIVHVFVCPGEWTLSPCKQMGLPVDHNFSCVSKKLFKGAKKCSQGLGNGLPLWVCGCACKGECVWPVFVIMNSPPPFPVSPAVLSVCVFELLYVPGDPHFPYIWGQSQFCYTNKKEKVHRTEGIRATAGFLEVPESAIGAILDYYGELLLSNSIPDLSTEVDEKYRGNLVHCQVFKGDLLCSFLQDVK